MTDDRPTDEAAPRRSLSRRNFLQGVGGATVATVAVQALNVRTALPAGAATTSTAAASPATLRRDAARQVRVNAAQIAFARPMTVGAANGEEAAYSALRLGNFSKGLPHNGLGEVNARAYSSLLRALNTGVNANFEAIPMNGVRRLTSPQAGMAFDLEGPDGQDIAIRPAPGSTAPRRPVRRPSCTGWRWPGTFHSPTTPPTR